MGAFENNVYSTVVGWNFLYMSKSICSKVCFNSNVALLIFCLNDPSIVDSGVVKSSTIIVSPLRSVVNCLICFAA